MNQSLLRCSACIISIFLNAAIWPPVHRNIDAIRLQEAAASAPGAGSNGILLQEGTQITLQLFEDVSSKDNYAGQVVMWSVYKDVKALNAKGELVTVIAPNAWADGKIKIVRKKGVFGRPGRIAVGVNTVEAVDGQKIPVYCDAVDVQGRERRAIAWCLGIGLSIVGLVIFSTLSSGGGLFLIAVLPMFLGLFISGKDVTIQGKYTIVVARVQRDTIIVP
jgi:hypothetical protein